MYNHENGLDDGSVNPPAAVNAFVQSADFDIGDGQQFMLINRVIPDLNFSDSDAAAPQVTFTMGARNYNGSAAGQGSVNGDVVRSSVVSGTDNYTDQVQNEATRTTEREREREMRPDGRR